MNIFSFRFCGKFKVLEILREQMIATLSIILIGGRKCFNELIYLFNLSCAVFLSHCGLVQKIPYQKGKYRF